MADGPECARGSVKGLKVREIFKVVKVNRAC